MGRLIVIQCAQEFEPDALDLEIGLTLEGGEWDGHAPHVAGERLERRRLPAIESAAVCVRVGPPEEVHQQSQALARCIEEEGLQIAGPNREVFLRPPTPAAPPIIEMQFPVVRLS
ncbi:MAG: GyrI-like domain-containing protein [Polyangiaceae bacterium]|nr:GyrI-like domain-containing protein [Polyangiaceae bacterium]MCB9606904.1 GyrI-like domain-containing protein [Polyangiaceae bacterium]